MTNPLMTVGDIAETLRLSVATVWRKIRAGDLPQPFYVAERRPRWHRADIESWLASRSATPRDRIENRRARRRERLAE